MRLPVDDQYREERRIHRLKLHCEDCALFDDRTERCAHGYPTDAHRTPQCEADDQWVMFCKDFEVA